MSDLTQDDVLPSLRRAVSGLTIIFWCLPLALVFSIQNLLTIWLRVAGALTPVALTGAMFYGLWQLGTLQPREAAWARAVDRAKFAALALFGLSPFVHWRSQLPEQPYFNAAMTVLFAVGIAFLYSLNVLLVRLAAMLPDEALRGDAKLFTAFNRGLLLGIVLYTGSLLLTITLTGEPADPGAVQKPTWLQERLGIESIPEFLRGIALLLYAELRWTLLVLTLLPVAITMSLMWKVKEAILSQVFRNRAAG